jgi:hypothetical protein
MSYCLWARSSSDMRKVISGLGAILLLALLVRFFPVAAAFTESAALSLRRFWALVLLVLLVGWTCWAFRPRRSSQRPKEKIVEGEVLDRRAKE